MEYQKIIKLFDETTNFWGTLEMPLINCEISLMFT